MARLSDFDFVLPPELIAQEPLSDRDGSRLLHVGAAGELSHRTFRDLPGLLAPGDLLVVNETRVFPARLVGRRASGGAVELLLLEEADDRSFRVLGRPARKLRPGTELRFGDGRLGAEVVSEEPEGRRIVRFDVREKLVELLDELGTTPLPPYIESSADEGETRERYQTIYARHRGSVAAPTAGMHFTDALFGALRERGVGVAPVTLHVGYATFEPIRTEDFTAHRMGRERFHVPRETVERIYETRAAGGRIVAVGTTTVRALESAAAAGFPDGFRDTELFITPGFPFRVVSGLVTNFHLPRSSLLLLVSALAGRESLLAAYREAVSARYRFYSFGDAMLVYPARHGATA